ncbi:hypothetical protein CDCA_CDCA19G4747 [Cyanidium caldarium]|uniref:Uncharacterized protein n=1 Tax=Cyanidium caldarium TaxID=2771 RepID=A0AAV9J2B9_CYACA|nr:hypothetical protein CDCA_CDCA19G4747 [Cyanidium caldarium]
MPTEGHRHRATSIYKQCNKRFKGNGGRRDRGRVAATPGHSSGPVRATAPRPVRAALAKQARAVQQQRVQDEKRGRYGLAPQLVLVLGVTAAVDAREVLPLLAAGGVEAEWQRSEEGGYVRCLVGVPSARPHRRVGLLALARDAPIEAVLDALKVVDTVLLAHAEGERMDTVGERCCALLRAQGLPTAVGVAVPGNAMEEVPTANDRQRPSAHALQHRSPYRQWARQLAEASILGPDDKPVRVWPVHSAAQATAVLQYLGQCKVRLVKWRAYRPYLLVEKVAWQPPTEVDGHPSGGMVQLSGWLRGAATSVDRLLHLTGIGTYRVRHLTTWAPPPPGLHGMPVETPSCTSSGNGRCAEPLDSEAEPEASDMESATSEERAGVPVTEAYPREWPERHPDGSLEAGDDSDSDTTEKDDMDAAPLSELQRRAHDEMLFPDEVDTPHDRPARERFARYRGLQSLRKSPWSAHDHLPREYGRIHRFENIRATRKAVLAEAESGEARPHTWVTFTIERVEAPEAACLRGHQWPLVATSLLPHENRRTVVHCRVQRAGGASPVIRSGARLCFHIGYRRFVGRALFSEDNAKCDKHLLERFLQPGRWSVASLYAHNMYPPAPVVLTAAEAPERLLASGTLLGADTDRLILRRVVLTGAPMRTHKHRATVRRMFHNPEDVKWFRPVELWTKYGRTGHIVEPLGTHGAFKAVFDGVIHQHDTVCMSLYRRVFPPPWDDSAGEDESDHESAGVS